MELHIRCQIRLIQTNLNSTYASLKHEVFDDTVERRALVMQSILLSCTKHSEVLGCFGSDVLVNLHHNTKCNTKELN